MLKKASSLRYPPPYQPQRISLSNMDTRPPPLHTLQPPQQYQSGRTSQHEPLPLHTNLDASQMQSSPPQTTSQAFPQRQDTGFSFSDHDSLWQIGENAYSYRTLDPVIREENLRIYRELVGITTSPSMTAHDSRISSISYLCFRRPAKNVGYYQRIVDDEFKASIWYTSATWSINILLGLQIAIAAVLTALGVTEAPKKGLAISILAACNTATATLLTYLKAKGQPLRALQYRDALRQLKEHVEYTERLFELGITGGGQLNPAKAAGEIKQNYDQVQAAQEKSEEASEAAALGSHPAAQAGSPVGAKTGRKLGIGGVEGPDAHGNPSKSAHDTAADLV